MRTALTLPEVIQELGPCFAERFLPLEHQPGDSMDSMGQNQPVKETDPKSILQNDQHKEGEITKMIERQTAKIPSVGFLTLALGSMAISGGLALIQRRKGWANFVGEWVPTFLLLGIYNKLVKLEGSDQGTPANRISHGSNLH